MKMKVLYFIHPKGCRMMMNEIIKNLKLENESSVCNFMKFTATLCDYTRIAAFFILIYGVLMLFKN